MENNENDLPVTSAALKGSDEVEHATQPTTVTDKPTGTTSPQRPDEANHKDVEVVVESSSQSKGAAEAQPESRDVPSAEAKPSASSSTVATPNYVPPVKRFSAVNINKKFLEKNQPTTAAGSGASSGSSGNKQAGVLARPAPQTAHSHSRLVTAKLTATPISSSPGQGWSRPNSVTPPAPSPANASGSTKGPTPTNASVGGYGPPHIAHGGKIVHPQVVKHNVDGPGRPAWRSVQPGAINSALQTQNEFPTAAEAAQSRLMKLADAKAASEVHDAQKQALSETADAFRGVHLDPNAHHWDEIDEEDNDDFLGDVIEFGDGRQYTIQASDGANADPKALGGSSSNAGGEGPVSKAERFADDFDRSWPKSRQEPGKDEPTQHRRPSHSETSSNFSGHSPVSLRDGTQSRLLFNERLNRMEPISGGRPGPGPHVPSRGVQIHRDRPDGPGGFHSNRIERDAPPHSAFRRPQESSWNTPHGAEQHSRDIQELRSESPTSYFHGHGENPDRKGRSEWTSTRPHGGPLPNGRPFGSRETSASRSIVNGAPSVASSDGHSSRYAGSIRDQHREHFPQLGHHGDTNRQTPPHLAHLQSTPAPEGALDGSDTRGSGSNARVDVPSEAVSAKDKDQLQSTHPAQIQSDVVSEKAATVVPPDDVEALRKAYLAASAERAKKRRQQEEEERLKAQERARKKAAELEAKMAAAKSGEATKHALQPTAKPEEKVIPAFIVEPVKKPTEAEVLQVIEGAIGSATASGISYNGKTSEPRGKESDGQNPPSGKALSTTHEVQESGQLRAPPSNTPADRVDSWRAKSKPPVLPVENSKNDISHEPAMSVLPDVRAFDLQADENMEVIDFSDMSRLVGEKAPQKPVSEMDPTSSRPTRPVASDFFKGPSAQKPEPDSWRRGGPVSHQGYSATTENEPGHASHQETPASSLVAKADTHGNEISFEQYAKVPSNWQSPSSQTNGFVSPAVPNNAAHPSSPAVPRFLRSPNTTYREAPLSALDDTMSRIKGALDVMHSVADHGSKNEGKEPVSSSTVRLPNPSANLSQPATKWLPPARRPPGTVVNNIRTDTFEPTHPEPPLSPTPPDDGPSIHLPSTSRRIEPLTKRQSSYWRYSGPVRWEILSFDPPVEGMTKKSLSVNDVLFRKPQGPLKSRKYRVLLPKPKAAPRQAFGNGERAAEKPASPTLDVTSRSPPPELVEKAECIPTVSGVASKPKPSQKSLDVTDVAFYRDGRRHSDNKSNGPAVTFTVGSELEGQTDISPSRRTPVLFSEASRLQPSGVSETSTPGVKVASLPYSNALTTQTSLRSGNAELYSSSTASTQATTRAETSVDNKSFEQQNDPFLQRQTVTPPPQNTPPSWAKSPARAPDPEHLKAVWSQASNSDTVPAVNSLKNIADDLTSVPFMLQEVKSEGGTPPPAPPGPVAPPTRMSASEVTRAFQTVPSGPSNGMTSSALRSNQLPSNLGSPIGSQRALKPPAIGLPPPPSFNPNAPRPPYMSYPTAMSTHSPSPPTLVYSHVMPNGMGSSPSGSPYGQPVWMSVVHQQSPQMLRAQSSSPYSPSMMPYPMPMPNPQGSPAIYPSAPPPGQMMVSPVLSHASVAPPHAMYPGSPLVMHVPPPGGAPQVRPYPPNAVGMGRGSMAVQNQMDPRSHPAPGPQPAPPSRFSVPNSGYTPVPQSFGRW